MEAWQEFCDSGLLWFINGFLRPIDYQIVVTRDANGVVTDVRPEKTTWVPGTAVLPDGTDKDNLHRYLRSIGKAK